MEKYIEPVIGIIAFDNEDVITTSDYFSLPDMPIEK